ncbi:hypothetical protein [Maribacter sp. 2210JD10-5]|uniref:hypothetical protein n=1 Tax=Maribacter sp. 2210JD10-5 TaxID=3386272 RepID=UPI0039BD4A12
MLFFFGSRATKIKERRLRNTKCPYCETKDSFTVATFSKYFHFFWIPIIPLFKTHVAECSHCKKSYAKGQFTPEMLRSLENENRVNPAKKPIWQGCGCIVLVLFFGTMLAFSFYGVYMRSQNPEKYKIELDPRLELLNADMDKLSRRVQRDTDSLTFSLKECVAYDIVDGIDTDEIGYFTKWNGDKLLVLLKVNDIKKIEAKYRKELFDVIEDCMDDINPKDSITEYYMAVEGKWNTVLVKTPTDADLGGRFADKKKLLPFYGEKPLPIEKTEMDSILK